MLAELYIRNFAIIDDLRIRFFNGLNVLTGETGAGKSIILDAMTLVLGERADTTMIREGCEEAYVEAAFELDSDQRSGIGPLLEAEGLAGDQADLLLLARELRTSGRNICRLNGRAVNLALLKEVGDRLVDIHGQGEHLSLLRPRSHLPLLDAYAGLEEERRSLAEQVGRLIKVRNELSTLRQNERELAQRVDLLKYQIEEIDAANLTPGEEDDLRAERARVANVERLIQLSTSALASLSGQDEDALSASDLLSDAERMLEQLARLDPEQNENYALLQGLNYQLNDLTAELIRYREGLEFEPGRLDFLEERIELINRLKRKYGDDISGVLAYRDRAAAELDGISRSEDRIEELIREEDQLLHQIGEQGRLLSEKRQVAAQVLASSLEKELADLNMDRAKFEVLITQQPDENGAYVGPDRLAFDRSGIDKVEFLVSANPGESPRPLAKVASGGETSRLMLALKTVLAKVDATPTLIFDEIDQGIGGRVGDVVGRKLWGLTMPPKHQVIVVTHLPQLAGYADGHYNVSKRLVNGRTTTVVKPLNDGDRVDELAAMLGTEGEHATGSARSILQRVAAVKTSA
ncbi:MAG: DNA repair protein RecN [Chloroflexota bacterium]|jgi:DNA repair protein RecN (Recombination protein N)